MKGGAGLVRGIAFAILLVAVPGRALALCTDDADCTAPCQICTQGICKTNIAGDPTNCPGTVGPCQRKICNPGCTTIVATNAACTPTSPNSCQLSTGKCNASAVCVPNPKAAGTACSDGNACTTESCNGAGACTVTATKACTTPPTPCHKSTGTCNPATGACSYEVALGKACNDGKPCTKADACQPDGSCQGVAYTCALPGPPHTACWIRNDCDGAGGCISEHKAQGTLCNADMNECTTPDACDQGMCKAGPARACDTPPNSQCYEPTGVCTDSTTGACTYTKKPSGTTCDDGDPCTYNDRCQVNGDCKGTPGKSCGATAECPIASMCDGQGGCTPPADRETVGDCAGKSPGDACSTCNPCRQGQACDAKGQCVGAAVADNTPCATETCLAGICMAGECACMTPAPAPDLGVSPPGGDDAGGGGDSGSGEGGGGDGQGGEKGGCAMAGREADARPLFIVAALLLLLAMRLRRA